MSNHDTALALPIIGAALLWWALAALGKRRRIQQQIQRRLRQERVRARYSNSYFDSEFGRIATELDPQPTPYDHEQDGL